MRSHPPSLSSLSCLSVKMIPSATGMHGAGFDAKFRIEEIKGMAGDAWQRFGEREQHH